MQLWAKKWLNTGPNGGKTGLAPTEVLVRTREDTIWSNHRLKIQSAAKLTTHRTRISLSFDLNPGSQVAIWPRGRLKNSVAAKVATSWAKWRSGYQEVSLSLELKFGVQVDKKERVEEGEHSCRFTSLVATISIGNNSFQHFLVPFKMRSFQ